MKLNLSTILNNTLPHIKEKGRMLDYYLILNLINDEDYEKEILNELLKYQNNDGGFGNGLEPDVQMPYSSTLATDIACDILDNIKVDNEELIKKMVEYLETQYNEDTKSFIFVSEVAMDYPHAVWWNYDGVDEFGYLNPNPEVIGFLYKHRKYLTKINIEELLDYMIDYIKNNIADCDKEHSLYSIRRLVNRAKIDGELSTLLVKQEEKVMITDKSKWNQYVAEPVMFINDKHHSLYEKYKDIVLENIIYMLSDINNGVWYPKWTWFQYDDVFEDNVRFEWMAYITYKNIKLLKNFNMIDFNA